MEIDASSLPPSLRKQLLDRIRGQIGEAEFQSLVETIGEDALLESMLARSAGTFGAFGKRINRFNKETVVFWICAGLTGLFVTAMGLGGYKEGGCGEAVFTVVCSVIIGAVAFARLRGTVRRHCESLFIPLTVGLFLLTAYVLWKAVTYAAAGTTSWFGWLVGHF